MQDARNTAGLTPKPNSAPQANPPQANPPQANPPQAGKILVFTAPSGAGKTTLVRHLLDALPERLAFSVSATTRPPRAHEVDGRDYHFLSREDFERRARAGEFLEYEEVYAGTYYGTLASEVTRLWAEGKVVLFDIEVKGATNIKARFGDAAHVVFVAPPDEETLYARLRGRGTEDESSLARRIARAAEELAYRERFDRVLVNDDLDAAKAEAEAVCRAWL